MTIRLFGCVCGQFNSPGAGLGMAAERVSVPIPFYVVEHPDGVALFDCGLHAGLTDAEDPYRVALRTQDLDSTVEADELAAAHLERLDIDPARVRYVVLSHLHFDHAGGLHQLPNATVVVQKREWEAGFDEGMARRYFLPRRFYDLGHQVKLVDGEHDLFGDGAVTLHPSFGHTPGHQSMRVRSAMGDHILVGDACYNCEAAETRNFPEYSDHAAMNRSLDGLLAMREEGTVMVFGHDPGQWGERPVLPSVRT
ncbi:N-acyl homoserine lactonase family protein [Phenylobacterium sp.]|uniref:N-acyl homoserine lactonase family protein n=1 Tax=Phenylobacterium sp. TaxID=1871053 RepID=UPI00391CC684